MNFRCTSRWQRVFGASVFSLFFFLETGAYFGRNGTQPGLLAFTTVFLAILAWLAVRAARSATLRAGDETITVRSFLRTRSWRWDEVAGFVVDTRLVGAWAKYRRRVLGLRERDGSIRWFSELNCRPARGARGSWVDDAAVTLNRHLMNRHRTPDAGGRPGPWREPGGSVT